MGIVGSPEIADWKSPAGKASAPNEPNFSRPGRLPEEIVQNKAKLGERGVYRQMVSYGPWLGRRVKRAKRTQFRRVGRGGVPIIPLFHHSNPMAIVRNEPNFAPRPEGKCAKQTQFPPPGGRWRRKSCETNPIGPGRTWGARTGCQVWSCRCQVRKVRHAGLGLRTSNLTLPHGNCAKQSQTWEDWAM
jgi:hypothetical protein